MTCRLNMYCSDIWKDILVFIKNWHSTATRVILPFWRRVWPGATLLLVVATPRPCQWSIKRKFVGDHVIARRRTTSGDMLCRMMQYVSDAQWRSGDHASCLHPWWHVVPDDTTMYAVWRTCCAGWYKQRADWRHGCNDQKIIAGSLKLNWVVETQTNLNCYVLHANTDQPSHKIQWRAD